ncbi:MAG: flagellar FliJ family protein [Mariprofundaceae bacterium]
MSPHEVLAKLAGHERTKAEEALAAMAARRQELQGRCEEVTVYLTQLKQQREQILKGGTQASMLLMMESAMEEQHERIEKIEAALLRIHEQEQLLIQGWIVSNQKNKIHEKMQDASDKKEQRLQDRKSQQQLDDIFASRKKEEAEHS